MAYVVTWLSFDPSDFPKFFLHVMCRTACLPFIFALFFGGCIRFAAAFLEV